MRTKRVNRYYCDWCKKAGCSAGHMNRHEKGCTKNPDRVCGVCGMLEESQSEINELIALLPHPRDHVLHDEYATTLTTAANESLPGLREAANNCPACILAAIRQRAIPVPMVTDFSWTREMQAVWHKINSDNATLEHPG